MITREMQSHIHYKHEPAETARLLKAVEPMLENIRAVTSGSGVRDMFLVLKGGYFRRWQAKNMKNALVKACKHARANLSDYFPMLRESVMAQTEELETAVAQYWHNFEYLAAEKLPTD